MADFMSSSSGASTNDGIGESTSLMSNQKRESQETYGIPSDNGILLERGASGHLSDDVLSDSTTSSAVHEIHGTTPLEAFTNLMKGYIGAGMLSLPWALSQLGLYYGCFLIFLMSLWTSYNCWTVVRLKRFIERTENQNFGITGDDTSVESSPRSFRRHSSGLERLESVSVTSSRSNITFPDVGEWAFGRSFQSFVSACVCTQQLAICTVFISFIGENLLAVFERLHFTGFLGSHVGVMTLVLPGVMSLSFLPTMKRLVPAMGLGFVALATCLILLGVIMNKEWTDRPDDLPTFKLPKLPMAACAILYTYEGICLVLPVESSMKEPKQFKKVFVSSMFVCAVALAAFATICVVTFGEVTSGSVTAFLVESFEDDPSITWLLMGANIAISLSVLCTYPIQLFPALELIGKSSFAQWIGGFDKSRKEDDSSLSGFDPLPVLPEHEVAEDSLPSEHDYNADPIIDGQDVASEEQDDEKSYLSQNIVDMLPKMIMEGDSIPLRAFLVIMTYIIASVIPNVQALISLVGALAGSSTALLIPPLLELSYFNTLDEHHRRKVEVAERSTGNPTSSSLHGSTQIESDGLFRVQNSRPGHNSIFILGGRYWASRLKCSLLLLLGVVFSLIGTFASIRDIIHIYLEAS